MTVGGMGFIPERLLMIDDDDEYIGIGMLCKSDKPSIIIIIIIYGTPRITAPPRGTAPQRLLLVGMGFFPEWHLMWLW